jgi:DNA-binding HxlR family transcriptional regulator
MVGFTPILEKFSISPSILSSTLKELNTKMLISRNVSGDITPITVEYCVTEQGYELIQILSDLFLWYQKYLQLS